MTNPQRRHDISDAAWTLLELICLSKAGNGEM